MKAADVFRRNNVRKLAELSSCGICRFSARIGTLSKSKSKFHQSDTQGGRLGLLKPRPKSFRICSSFHYRHWYNIPTAWDAILSMRDSYRSAID